jgi:hypothetical protein
MQSVVKLGWFGLFVVLLGRLATGSSFQLRYSTVFTDSTTSYHFVPHLSRKSFIVKQKLLGTIPTVGSFRKTTSRCG